MGLVITPQPELERETMTECFCGFCEVERFQNYMDRIQTMTPDEWNSEDDEGPLMTLIREIHRDMGQRHPLGIARDMSLAIEDLIIADGEGAWSTLNSLVKSELRSIEVNDLKREGYCKKDGASREENVEPAWVNSKLASEEKGYPHPGSFITLGPDEHKTIIHLQYGHPDEVGRNGIFIHELYDALAEHLSVYQSPGHKMRTRETAMVITKLDEASLWTQKRTLDRKKRGVHETDKA